jgi:hypothetical protein
MHADILKRNILSVNPDFLYEAAQHHDKPALPHTIPETQE